MTLRIVTPLIMNRGRYNGFGGKVDQGETPLEAAKRELEVRVRYASVHGVFD